MSALLDAGADPFAEVRDGRTIVADVARSRKASVAERVAMLRRLVEAGVDLDRSGDMAFTPLADVAMGGNADAVEALLLAGADPRTERNALGTVCFAYSSDRNPGIERTIDLLVAAGLDPNDTDEWGNSPLHAALSADAYGPQYTESDGINVAAAFALLRHGASIDIAYRDTGYRPLHAAAAGGSAGLVDALLQAGADPTERANGGETPLAVARAVAAEDCVRLLEAASPSD
jgi:cytohesin